MPSLRVRPPEAESDRRRCAAWAVAPVIDWQHQGGSIRGVRALLYTPAELGTGSEAGRNARAPRSTGSVIWRARARGAVQNAPAATI